MKEKTLFSELKSVWLPLGVLAAALVGLSIAGNILVVADKLRAVHPYAEWAFYGVLAVVALWCAKGVLATLVAPALTPEEIAGLQTTADARKLRRVASSWARSGMLRGDPLQDELTTSLKLGRDLRPLVGRVLAYQSDETAKVVKSHAVLVFVSTAVSQNGRWDALAVIITNFRMLNELVRVSGYRPSLVRLARLYATVFMAALVADRIEEIDMETVLGTKGAEVLGAIPGLSLVLSSVADGSINALVTLRIGHIARACLTGPGLRLQRAELRRLGGEQARKDWPAVVKEGVGKVPGAVGKAVDAVL